MVRTFSHHAEQRARERAAHIDIAALWNTGRNAGQRDFERFNTVPFPDRCYRVAVAKHQTYLIVQGKHTRQFITIIRLQA